MGVSLSLYFAPLFRGRRKCLLSRSPSQFIYLLQQKVKAEKREGKKGILFPFPQAENIAFFTSLSTCKLTRA